MMAPAKSARTKKSKEPSLFDEQVPSKALVDEVESAFLEYAMSVIVSRALPDVRDGLKPVHRRILWAMHDAGIRSDRPFVKSARVIGDVMGRYHPHGDQSIYEALVRMGQHFSLSLPLIDPHGNFGSPNDPAAAMRYTECRLSLVADQLLRDIDEDTVDFVDNFDASQQEPVVLPSRIPNILINGSQGIAVGIATNIPPHNPMEVIKAAIYLIDHEEATSKDLAKIIKGPDFPTGATILGTDGIAEMYSKGRGSIRVRGEHVLEESKGKTSIVVTSIPYQTSIESIAEKAAEAVESGTISGVKDIRNESGQGQTRLVIECKPGTDTSVVLNNLYKHTTLQSSVPVNMIALVDGVPKTLNLDDMLRAWVTHQVEVIRRRSSFRLEKAQARCHIVEGLVRAVDMIDAIIKTIRASKDRSVARTKLMAGKFAFSEIQANHILDLALGRLTELGQKELSEELKALKKEIKELTALLKSSSKVRELIKSDLEEFMSTLVSPRRTKIEKADTGDLSTTALVAEEDLVINVSARNYVRAIPVSSKASKITSTKDRDSVESVYELTSLNSLIIISNLGRAYRVPCYELPKDRLAAVSTLVSFTSGEKPVGVIDIDNIEAIALVTNKGGIKKIDAQALSEIATRKDGVVCAKLGSGEVIVSAREVHEDEEHQMVIVTKNGQGIRFMLSDVRSTSRSAGTIRAMKIKSDDEVIGAISVYEDDDCVITTDKGFAKRMHINSLTLQARGGSGLKAMKIQPSRGTVKDMCIALGDETTFLTDTTSTDCATTAIALQDREGSGSKVKGVSGSIIGVSPVADAI
jgi:DNA gyrase subunit A